MLEQLSKYFDLGQIEPSTINDLISFCEEICEEISKDGVEVKLNCWDQCDDETTVFFSFDNINFDIVFEYYSNTFHTQCGSVYDDDHTLKYLLMLELNKEVIKRNSF